MTVYEEEGATKKFFVSSGSITINDDSSVQVGEYTVSVSHTPNQALLRTLSNVERGAQLL